MSRKAGRKIEQTGICKLLLFVHENGRFVASWTFHAKADRDETVVLGWRHQSADDIRTGWERADLKLQDAPNSRPN
ncbi:MAG: hypothetical protein ACLFV7_06895 [Phycisphaerae bacterium]